MDQKFRPGSAEQFLSSTPINSGHLVGFSWWMGCSGGPSWIQPRARVLVGMAGVVGSAGQGVRAPTHHLSNMHVGLLERVSQETQEEAAALLLIWFWNSHIITVTLSWSSKSLREVLLQLMGISVAKNMWLS